MVPIMIPNVLCAVEFRIDPVLGPRSSALKTQVVSRRHHLQ